MTQPLIDIFADESKPEGGHAIVLLRAVAALPDPLHFTISALLDDPDDRSSAAMWSLDEQQPLAARLTSDGLEMKIGPALVDAPELQPGTPVMIAVPSAEIQAELSWPDLPVTIPPSLPAPLMDPSDLRAHKIENAQRDAAQLEADKALDAAIAASIAGETSSHQALNDSAPLSSANLDDISAAISKTKLAVKTTASVKAPTLSSTPLNLAVDSTEDAPLPTTTADGATLSHSALPIPTRDVVPTSQAVVAARQNGGRNNRGRLSIVLALIAIPAMLFAFWPSISSRIGDQAAVKGAIEKLASSDWVTRILAVGDISPGGIDASSVSASEALKRAEAAIFNEDSATNLAERKFWLRKSISLLLSEPESRWAATQLGALHTASPDPKQQPDYRSAKTLWEIASASGDTVATCFLAQLYELGLGVIASKEKAQRWHERAAQRGGCNVQHERPAPALTN